MGISTIGKRSTIMWFVIMFPLLNLLDQNVRKRMTIKNRDLNRSLFHKNILNCYIESKVVRKEE